MALGTVTVGQFRGLLFFAPQPFAHGITLFLSVCVCVGPWLIFTYDFLGISARRAKRIIAGGRNATHPHR